MHNLTLLLESIRTIKSSMRIISQTGLFTTRLRELANTLGGRLELCARSTLHVHKRTLVPLTDITGWLKMNYNTVIFIVFHFWGIMALPSLCANFLDRIALFIVRADVQLFLLNICLVYFP